MKVGTSENYHIHDIGSAGLNSDFQTLTGHNDVNLDFDGLSYGSLSLDMGGRHWFAGFMWTFSLNPYPESSQSYYEPINTRTFAVSDNIMISTQRNQIEGRLGFGRFASEDVDDAFIGFGGYVFGGSQNVSIQVNNYTKRSLVHKNVTINSGDLFSQFETKRLVFGLAMVAFFTFGTGATSLGLGVELKYARVGEGDWTFQQNNVDFSNSSYNLFTINFCPQIYHNFGFD